MKAIERNAFDQEDGANKAGFGCKWIPFEGYSDSIVQRHCKFTDITIDYAVRSFSAIAL